MLGEKLSFTFCSFYWRLKCGRGTASRYVSIYDNDISYHAHSKTKGGDREVGGELGLNLARVSVGTGDAAPNDPVLRAFDGLGGLVDKSNTFTEVEHGSLLVVNSLQAENGGVGVGVAQSALVS